MSVDLAIRELTPQDSIEELTALLHRAYAGLGAMGLNYTAVDQSIAATRRDVRDGVCFVAADREERLCGTVLFRRSLKGTHAPWLEREGVAHFGRLGVDPDLQGHGLGTRLIAACELRATELGAREVALDTAEPATHLVTWYSRLGYRFIEHVQWKGKSYRSVIMSKTL